MMGLFGIDKCQEPVTDLVTDTAKGGKSFIMSPVHSRRVVKAPMKTSRVAGKSWAALFGIVTDRDDVVERLTDKFLDRF